MNPGIETDRIKTGSHSGSFVRCIRTVQGTASVVVTCSDEIARTNHTIRFHCTDRIRAACSQLMVINQAAIISEQGVEEQIATRSDSCGCPFAKRFKFAEKAVQKDSHCCACCRVGVAGSRAIARSN